MNYGEKGFVKIPLQRGPALLEACRAQMEASAEWFKSRALTLSLDQLRWRPKAGSWSIAECLEHLNTTLGFYLPRMEAAIDQACRKNRMSSHSLALHKQEQRFLNLFEPPIRVGVRAAAELSVAPAVDLDRLADQFHGLRNSYVEAAHKADGLDWAHIPVKQSVHPSIYSLGGTFALLAVHERRHLWQAENIRSALGFPRSLCDSSKKASIQNI